MRLASLRKGKFAVTQCDSLLHHMCTRKEYLFMDVLCASSKNSVQRSFQCLIHIEYVCKNSAISFVSQEVQEAPRMNENSSFTVEMSSCI